MAKVPTALAEEKVKPTDYVPTMPTSLAKIEVGENNPSTFNEDLEWEREAGKGFEDVTAQDIALPFLKILQSGNPEVKRTEPEYIPGAQEGMILNSVTKRAYREVTLVPCKMVTHHIEWMPNRGGFVKNHGTDRSILDECHRDEKIGRNTLPNGNIVSATPTWFCLLIGGKLIDLSKVDDPGTEVEEENSVVLTFTPTMMRTSKQWVSQAQALRLKNSQGLSYQPPIFAMSYKMTLAGTSNDQGSWYLPVIKAAGWLKNYPNAARLRKLASDYADQANQIHTQIQPREEEERRSSSTSYRSSPISARKEGEYDNKPLDPEIPF